MKARYHVLFGGIAASALIPVLGVNSTFFFLSTVFIDGDHYLDYLYRNRFNDFSIRRMFKFHDNILIVGGQKDFLALHVAHTVEALLCVWVVYALTDWLWLQAVFWGMLFHIFMDLIGLYRLRRVFRRAFSIIEFIIRWNLMKRRGLQPESLYRWAVQSITVLPDSPEDEIGRANQQD